MESSRLGDKALSDSDCPTAIQHFTQALIEHPRSPTYYIKRSTAYSRLKPADGGPDPLSALHDAELALFLARERGKRELILSAQMRRGVALYQLERYGDAALVLDIIQEKVKVGGGPGKNRSEEVKDAMAAGGTESIRSMQKNGFEQELPIWVIKVKGKLNKLEDGDEKAKVTAVEYPTDIKVPTEKELKAQLEALKAGKLDAGETHVLDEGKGKGVETDLIAMKLSQSNNEAGPVSSAPPPGPAPDKVRHEWYQSHDSVVVTLYVKGAPKDKTDSELHNESISIQFPLPSGTLFDFTLDPLYSPIDPSSSKVSVMSTKVEATLRKQTPGQKWSALEASPSDTKLADRPAATAPTQTQTSTAGPAYPTSSRHGAKDWDKVASDLSKKSKSNSKSGSKKKDKKAKKDPGPGDGNESDSSSASVDSDYAAGDPVDGFFKKLYAGADDDTRRAMVKSYVESQGTSLSTNWSEVGKGKVEVHQSKD